MADGANIPSQYTSTDISSCAFEDVESRAANLAGMVAERVSKQMQSVFEEMLLDAIENRVVHAIQKELLPFLPGSARGKGPQAAHTSAIAPPKDDEHGAVAFPNALSACTVKTSGKTPEPSEFGSETSKVACSTHCSHPAVMTSESSMETSLRCPAPEIMGVRSSLQLTAASSMPIGGLKSLGMVSIPSHASSQEHDARPLSSLASQPSLKRDRSSKISVVGSLVNDNVLRDLYPSRASTLTRISQGSEPALARGDGVLVLSLPRRASKVSESVNSIGRRIGRLFTPEQVQLMPPPNYSSDFDCISSVRGLTTEKAIQGIQEASASAADNSAVMEHEYTSQSEPMSNVSLLILRIAGILPWTDFWHEVRSSKWQRPSMWYQWLALVVATSGVVIYLRSFLIFRNYLNAEDNLADSDCYSYILLSDIPLTLGCLFGLLALATHTGSQALLETFQLLHTYACSEKFEQKWLHLVRRDLALTLLLWVVAVIERLRGTNVLQRASSGQLDVWSTLRIVTFVASSFVVLIIVACTLFCCRALASAVDAFCSTIVSSGSLDKAVPRWNVVQALLRKASGTIQTCMLVMLMTLIFILMFLTFDAYRIRSEGQLLGGAESGACIYVLVPGALLVFGISRAFLSAAQVSDACARVPSLINACDFSFGDIDTDRQYVVEYVIHSAAGFYMFEIQVTSDLTLKFTYMSVVAMFAFVINFVSSA